MTGKGMRQALWTESGLDVTGTDSYPPLAPGWARLSVGACGICGSDLHFWEGRAPRSVGTCPGHEVAGTILQAEDPTLPDAVFAVSPNVTCGRCDFCLTGRPNLCRRGGYGIGLGRDGGLADFIDAPVENLFPVPAGVGPVMASLSEPLAVALRGVGLAQLDAGSVVLVVGGGTIGLLCALLARDRAASVTITTRHPHQRRVAEDLGVTAIAPETVVQWGKEHRPDVVLETVGGTGDSIEQAIGAAGRGARVVLLGSFGVVPVDLGAAMFKELRLIGSFAYGTDRRGPEFRTAVWLLGRYQSELAPLQTHQFGLDDIEAAFACAADKKTGSVKVTIQP